MCLQCPICQATIQPEPTCTDYQNGVCHLLSEEKQQHVDALYQNREDNLAKPIHDYNGLPYNMAEQDFTWRIRCADVDLVKSLLRGKPTQSILDIGAWNGWLSHHLVRAGHCVTAIEYAAHPTDGLGAKHFYDVDWHAIQMDLTDLSIFQARFDVVIINHGLHFFTEPVEYIKQARQLLNPGGLLILLNLTFYRDPSERIRQIKAQTEQFERTYGYPYLLSPSRGYMTFEDRDLLIQQGIRLRTYPHLWKAHLKARIKKTAPIYNYGVQQL